MVSFSREDRYIVVKRSDLAKVVSHYQVHRFMETLLRVGQHLPKRKFLVVEADWPEYEPVWRMIESRVMGIPSELDTALSQLAALREELAQKVVLAVREVCELDPADSDDPECICIKASDLGAILSRHFEGVE